MSKAWTKDIVVDLGTFGNSKACHVLVDMLNNNAIPIYEKHRVLSHINIAIEHFINVSQIPVKSIREATMKMWLDLFLARVDKFYYPAKFKTFYKNVLCYLHKKYLEGVI